MMKQKFPNQFSNVSCRKQGIYKDSSIAMSNFMQLCNHESVRSKFRKEG